MLFHTCFIGAPGRALSINYTLLPSCTYAARKPAKGQILKMLTRTGLLSNTVIIFISDNGYQQGEHRIVEGKNFVYEESVKLPLLLRGPGIPAGQHISQLVANVDYAPTIVDLADATPSRVMDGSSLLPLIANPAIPWRNSFLLENLRTLNTPGSYFLGVHSGTAVYVEHEYPYQPDPPGPDEVEFYVDDPYQLDSKHNDPAYATLMSTMRDRLNILKTCSGVACWLP